MKSLQRSEMKNVFGGLPPASGCGIKVNGVWHPTGQGAGTTSGFLGHTVNGYDNTSWSPDGFVIYPEGGSYNGYVSNWCCDSCPWNSSQIA